MSMNIDSIFVELHIFHYKIMQDPLSLYGITHRDSVGFISNIHTEYKMIAVNIFIFDFIIHYIALLLIGVFMQLLLRSEKGISVSVAFIGAFVITLVNHLYFPQYQWSNYRVQVRGVESINRS
jgi:hypothetical protein